MRVSTVRSSLEDTLSLGACARSSVAENGQQQTDSNAMLSGTRRGNV